MGQAAVISLAEAVQVKRRSTVRVHLHRILDHVMDEVETELSTEQPTLEQIPRLSWDSARR